jgi:hypothetical protein
MLKKLRVLPFALIRLKDWAQFVIDSCEELDVRIVIWETSIRIECDVDLDRNDAHD